MKRIHAILPLVLTILACSQKSLDIEEPEKIVVDIYRSIDKYDTKNIARYLPDNTSSGIKNTMNISMFSLYQPFKLCGGIKDISIIKKEEILGKIKITSNLSFKGNCIDMVDEMLLIRINKRLVLDLNKKSNQMNDQIIGKY